jgi:hypothetical protein
MLRSSGLFDEHYYLAHNPDVARSGVDPLLHYLRNGGFEGRDPNPDFSSSWYLGHMTMSGTPASIRSFIMQDMAGTRVVWSRAS